MLYYIEADALGTPRVVVDRTRGATGTAIWTWDLQGEAFGTTAPNQNPDGDATNFVFNLRFPGQRFDSASGLNYNYFRDYEPGTGRYSQSDPIGLNGGISMYGYVSGNPYTYSDELGLSEFLKGCAIGSQGGSWSECAAKCGAKVLGLEDFIDVGLVASGQPISGTKRFRTPGSSRGTSLAGMAADRTFGRTRFPAGARLPTIVGGPGTGRRLAIAGTRSVARFAGRAVPVLGWGLLAWDAINFGLCIKKCTSGE